MPSPDVREQAAFGLGQMRDKRAVQPLIAALKDEDADVREKAVFALGQLRDPAAVEGLAACGQRTRMRMCVKRRCSRSARSAIAARSSR